MEIRECISCEWVGWAEDCLRPKHGESPSLCPVCNETTFIITPRCVAELNKLAHKARTDL